MTGTPGEFTAALRGLRVDAGNPSLRDLARVTGVPRSTLAALFDSRRSQLPPLDRTLAVVRALGVAEPRVAEWAAAWKRIRGSGPPVVEEASGADPVDPEAPPAATGPADEARTGTGEDRSGRSGPGRGRGRLALVFALGAALGVLATLGTLRLLRPAPTVLVGDYAVCRPGDLASPPPAPEVGPGLTREPVGHPIGYVGRAAADQQVLAGTSVVVPITSAVADGDALIVTLMLTSTCPGEVTVKDSQGNGYRVLADVADVSRHRVMVFAAFGVRALGAADSVTLGYPRASKYHVAVDEFRGVNSGVGYATASGSAGGTAFTTSATPVGCAAGSLQVAAIGSNSGTAPETTSGWTTLPVLKLSSYRLTTAWRLTPTAGPCAVTGTTTAQWAAALAVLR